MKSGKFKVEILVNGSAIKEYTHDGKTFVEGRAGKDYRIRVCNPTDHQVLAVVSVDGLSVMDGQEARLTSGGYLIDPRGDIEIPGYRLDNQKVAKFVFGKNGESYAAKMGFTENIGVIGCAIFEEKVKTVKLQEAFRFNPLPRPRPAIPRFPPEHWPWPDRGPKVFRDLGSDILIGSSADRKLTSSVQNLGTVFGPSEDHEVVDVEFEAQDKPAAEFWIVYDTKKGLEAYGVTLKSPVKVAVNPFPGGRGCPPPDGWKYR